MSTSHRCRDCGKFRKWKEIYLQEDGGITFEGVEPEEYFTCVFCTPIKSKEK